MAPHPLPNLLDPASARPAPQLSRRARQRIVGGSVAFVIVALVITRLRGGVAVGGINMRTDNVFGIPSPPRDISWWKTGTYISLAIVFVANVLLLALGIRDYVKTKSVLPLFVALGAAAFVVPEVFVDVLGGVYFTADANMPIFTMMGRDFGIFIFMAWFSYGFVPYAFYKLLLSNPSTKALWLGLVGAGVANVVNEEWLLLLRPYHHYGNQPLVLLHELPWWWIPCNAVGSILCASIAFRYRNSLLRGWRGGAMIVISPMCLFGVYGFIAMPSFIAVNSDFPWLPTQLLGFLTIALGIVLFMAILQMVLHRHPLDIEYVPRDDRRSDYP